MKNFQIKLEDIRLEDALSQIEALGGVSHQQRNCLRLLTEEMFSMMQTVLEHHEASFAISMKDGEYALTLNTRTSVSQKAQEEFMSMSSDGKNLAHRGLKGKMVALLESFAGGAAMPLPMDYCMPMDMGDYSHLWMLSNYMDNASAQEQADDWDGMEKSIIVNFADDILIGVRGDQLEMVVKKKF